MTHITSVFCRGLTRTINLGASKLHATENFPVTTATKILEITIKIYPNSCSMEDR